MSAEKHTPTPCVDDVTAELRCDALEMDRRNARGERANGDAERLRATADYIDNLVNSHDALVAALKGVLTEADGFNVSGVYFSEFAQKQLDAAWAALNAAGATND